METCCQSQMLLANKRSGTTTTDDVVKLGNSSKSCLCVSAIKIIMRVPSGASRPTTVASGQLDTSLSHSTHTHAGCVAAAVAATAKLAARRSCVYVYVLLLSSSRWQCVPNSWAGSENVLELYQEICCSRLVGAANCRQSVLDECDTRAYTQC